MNQQAIAILVRFAQIPAKILDAYLWTPTLDWMHGMEQLQIGFRPKHCGNMRTTAQGAMPE
jgi:hypothetical protein